MPTMNGRQMHHMRVSNEGTPKRMVIRETPMQMDDLGVPLFQNPPSRYLCSLISENVMEASGRKSLPEA